MTDKEVIDIFKKTGALLEGHFILTSGFHSPHYFQCAKVLQYPEYNTQFSSMIAAYFGDLNIDAVITPAVGGIVFGTEVGRQMNKRTIFAERENGKMTLRRGFEIKPGENYLVCEDVVTTGGSVFEVIKLLKDYGANTAGVGFIIDRSNGKADFGTKQYSLAKMEVIKYAEDELPDWLEKIPVTKPGSRDLKK
ncbi:MAG TPA: orotate phosphoribosyltransferase [Ignavibacteria bacterium]|nr:orotate phosphoribosyltransferase [Bacteroidota bacterium]HRI86223.1 orotate phosphoribosyltransferase [Ignavibacteria bacterium]HRK00787.1 orotate phosphoribosyltransferase [Ignavibacteria bacterium]